MAVTSRGCRFSFTLGGQTRYDAPVLAHPNRPLAGPHYGGSA